MKRFDELSTREILNLTNSDLEKYIKIECMYENVPLVQESFELSPPVGIPKQDVEVFVFKDMVFKSLELAEKARNFILEECDAYRKQWGIEHEGQLEKLKSSAYEMEIEKKQIYSNQLYEKIKDEKIRYDAQMKNYESAKNEWTDKVAEIQKVADKIADKYYDLKELDRKVDFLKKSFDIYLDAADGNKDEAFKFFEIANKEKIDEISDTGDDNFFYKRLLEQCGIEEVVAA